MKLYLCIDIHTKDIYSICAGIKEATEMDRKLIHQREKFGDEFEWAWIDIDSGISFDNGELKWKGPEKWN